MKMSKVRTDTFSDTFSFSYGNLLGKSGPLANANLYRFSSKEWHDNAGLYYYGYRFCEPNLQRWLNRDPLGDIGSLPVMTAASAPGFESNDDGEGDGDFMDDWVRVNRNLYAALGNNPHSFFDSFGLCDDSVSNAARQPGATGQLAREYLKEVAEQQARQRAKQAFTQKLREAFGNGLKASRKIKPDKLKELLSRDELKQAQEIAKGGMRKAAEMAKKADNPKSWNAALDAFETQLNRMNACKVALGS